MKLIMTLSVILLTGCTVWTPPKTDFQCLLDNAEEIRQYTFICSWSSEADYHCKQKARKYYWCVK